MGVNADVFTFVEQFDIPNRAVILDLGSQDLTLRTQADLAEVNAFIGKRGGTKLDVALPSTIEAGVAWRAAGFSYTCVDVDKRRDTVFVDLQSFDFPPELKGKFDVVMNWGTTEHLANPVGGFAFVHYACKPNGLMLHDVPIFGFGNHGLTNPTPKFWHQMRIVNGYEPVYSAIRACDENALGKANFFAPELAYIDGLDTIVGISSAIRAAFKKPGQDLVFLPPSDAVGGNITGVKLAYGALAPQIREGLCTSVEAKRSIAFGFTRLSAFYHSRFYRRVARRILTTAILAIT